jgi:hypothetical protein
MARDHLFRREDIPRNSREAGYKVVQASGPSKWYARPHTFFFVFLLRFNPTGAMELRIVKPSFKYTAGQWLFLQVPDVSPFQWHPVSVAVSLP